MEEVGGAPIPLHGDEPKPQEGLSPSMTHLKPLQQMQASLHTKRVQPSEAVPECREHGKRVGAPESREATCGEGENGGTGRGWGLEAGVGLGAVGWERPGARDW